MTLNDLGNNIGNFFSNLGSNVQRNPIVQRVESLPQQVQSLPQAARMYTPQPVKNYFNDVAVPSPQYGGAPPRLGRALQMIAHSPLQMDPRSPLPPNMDVGPLLSSAGQVGKLGLSGANALGQTGAIQMGTKAAIKAPKQTSALDLLFNRTRNVIEQQGPAGVELAQKLQSARDTGETAAGNWVSQLPTVRKLASKEFENFVDVAEGKAQPLNAKVAQAAQEWSNVRGDIYNTAKGAGLDIGQLENYFPHRYDPKMFQGDNFIKAVQHLVETGQATDAQDAAQKLRYAQDVVRNRPHGNLEMERLVNLPGYDKTKQALFGYVESAAKRIGQVTHLGQNDSEAMGLINQIGQQGGDAAAAKNAYDIASGAKKYDQAAQGISGALRSFQGLTKLSTSAISNTGQSLNTATVTGALRTIGNIPKALSPEGRDFALRAGTTLDGVIQDLREGAGFSGKVLGKLSSPGFNSVEKFNRTLAAVAGRDYARALASSGNTKALAKMGITLEGNKLTPAQEIQAARNIVERTQFKVDPQDLPGWASSPWGKLFAQFKNFSYNQSAFVAREIIAPLKDKNVMPLARFLLLGSLVGEGIGDTKAFIKRRDRPQGFAARELDNLSTAGGGGIIQDAISAAQRGPDAVMQFISGPTIGEASKLAGGIGFATQGKPKTLTKQVLGDVPLVGQTISNSIYPPTGTYRARTPDIPIENAGAADTNPTASSPTAGLTPVEIAKIKQQITDLRKVEKTTLANSGMNLPFLGQVGGITEDQKNQQLSQIQTHIKSLEDSLKVSTPADKLGLQTAQYNLDASRARRADDFQSYVNSTQQQIATLQDYQKGLDPQKDQKLVLSTQNRIESLQATLDKYSSYGGFIKPKKPKAPRKIGVIRSSKPARIAFKTSKAKVGTVKFPKSPTLKLAKGKAPKTFKAPSALTFRPKKASIRA